MNFKTVFATIKNWLNSKPDYIPVLMYGYPYWFINGFVLILILTFLIGVVWHLFS